ncbi:hypothetical protein LRP30_33105 [Bradyrhizobium sp. C-145]|uniref:hypothetical protein n=1 Tax=Bradyrhizobium sp. C-145 TaxID=574727 RepID=UPI00201B6284|nr:hypothetical protein [Bradyrhizobium sp. C-145]UQR61625.1 hypothetical protein LRP30_33105 [Bradyrhizobium sp. C-145]
MLAAEARGQDFNELRMAFGLAGAYDRSLVEEVAKSELSLIRHNLLLRRLVMRYMKALLSLIWTAIVSFALVALLRNKLLIPETGSPENTLLVVTLSFFLWATLTPAIIRSPVRWTYSEYDQNTSDSTRDPHLVHFERGVTVVCIIACVLGTVGLFPFWEYRSLYLLVGPLFAALVLAKSFGRLATGPLRWL